MYYFYTTKHIRLVGQFYTRSIFICRGRQQISLIEVCTDGIGLEESSAI